MQEITTTTPITKRKIIRLGMTGETRDRIKSLAQKSGYGPKQTTKQTIYTASQLTLNTFFPLLCLTLLKIL